MHAYLIMCYIRPFSGHFDAMQWTYGHSFIVDNINNIMYYL
jgi:hypothetical protein